MCWDHVASKLQSLSQFVHAMSYEDFEYEFEYDPVETEVRHCGGSRLLYVVFFWQTILDFLRWSRP